MSSINPIDEAGLIAWIAIGAALALLWLLLVLLPFAVFGTKRRLDRLSAQLGEIHEELRRLNERSQAFGMPPLRAVPPDEVPAGDTRIRLHADQEDRLR